jgi:hypothetical protein
MHEPLTNLRKLIVIQLRTDTLEAEVWRALLRRLGLLLGGWQDDRRGQRGHPA